MACNSLNYVFSLDDEAKNFAEKLLNETDETRQKAFEELRVWIEDNPQLHVNPTEKSLLAFLRGCKFNLGRTKTKLRNFYEMKRDRREWYSNRNPRSTEIQELVKLGIFVPLLQPNADNQMVVIIKVAAHDPSRYKINDVFKTGMMILDMACEEKEEAQIYGVTAIFDMQGISVGHAKQLKPANIKNAVYAWQNYHCRPKRLEFINAPFYVNVVLNIFRSYMSAKLKGRVRVHFNTLEKLYQAVSKDVLPKEYGGNNGEMKDLIDFWYDKLLEYSGWFREDEEYKSDP